MRIKLIGILGMTLLFTILMTLGVTAGISSCSFTQGGDTALVNGAILSGSSLSMNASITYDLTDFQIRDNITGVTWNLTGLDSGISRLVTNVSDGDTNETFYSAIADTTLFTESTFSLNISVSNSSNVVCAELFTGIVIDNSDIAVPLLEQGPNASTVLAQGDGPVIFNITVGLANEEVTTAILHLGGNIHTMTISGGNKTQAFITLTENQIPSLTYEYFVRVTDSDLTTTTDSAKHVFTADFDKKSIIGKLVTAQEESRLAGLSDNDKLIGFGLIALVAYLIFRKKGRG